MRLRETGGLRPRGLVVDVKLAEGEVVADHVPLLAERSHLRHLLFRARGVRRVGHVGVERDHRLRLRCALWQVRTYLCAVRVEFGNFKPYLLMNFDQLSYKLHGLVVRRNAVYMIVYYGGLDDHLHRPRVLGDEVPGVPLRRPDRAGGGSVVAEEMAAELVYIYLRAVS